MLYVSKEHIGRGKNQGQAQRKHQNQQDDHRIKHNGHSRHNPKHRHHNHIGNQGVPQVGQRRVYPGKNKHLHGKPHLDEHSAIVHQGGHSRIGSSHKHTPQYITRKIVHRVIFNRTAEQLGKNHGKNRHHKQRVQNAPDDSQVGTGVFTLDLPGGQFLNHEHILFSLFPGHFLLIFLLHA